MSTIKIYHDKHSTFDFDSIVETWTGSSRHTLPFDTDNWELGESYEQDKKWLEENTVAYTPVYMYDHSGQTISTTPFSCRWDSGQLGWAYITKETWKSEMNKKRISSKQRKQALRLIEAEIELIDTVMRGEVYGFVAPDGDSCFGFIGGDIKANGMLDHIDEMYHADAIRAFESGDIIY